MARAHAVNLLIRGFKPGDEPALWHVFFTAIHGLASRDYTPEQIVAWAAPQPDTERWNNRMRSLSPFVAECDGKVIGYADLQPDGYIDHFFVAHEFARRGVGSRLMQHLHEVAARRATARLFSNVSITARPFFEKFGFIMEYPQTVCLGSVTLRNFRMAKVLRPPG